MPYQRIPPHLDEDLREEAQRLDLSAEQVLERRYYGYEVQKDIAREAKESLDKYHASEVERDAINKAAELENYAKIKAWVEKATKEINGQVLLVEYDKIFKVKGE